MPSPVSDTVSTHVPASLRTSTVDPPARRRVPERVADEVGEDLADADRVDARLERRRRRSRPASRRRRRRATGSPRRPRARCAAHVHRLAVERERTRLRRATASAGRRGGGPSTAVSASRGARWSSSIGWTPSSIASMPPEIDRQRRPQLVGDVGQERLAVGAGPVEALRHRVERRREPAHRSWSAGPDADAGLAVGEALRRAREVRERADRRAEHADAGQDRDDDHDDRRRRR